MNIYSIIIYFVSCKFFLPANTSLKVHGLKTLTCQSHSFKLFPPVGLPLDTLDPLTSSIDDTFICWCILPTHANSLLHPIHYDSNPDRFFLNQVSPTRLTSLSRVTAVWPVFTKYYHFPFLIIR